MCVQIPNVDLLLEQDKEVGAYFSTKLSMSSYLDIYSAV